jgi:outer membrane protein assembly factor BamE
MPVLPIRRPHRARTASIALCAQPFLRAGLLALPCLLGACSSLSAQSSLTNALKPYRADVVQGNFVAKEMADQVQPGMTREQVRDLLGNPLLQDLFHADRWDYVFSLRQGYQAPLVRRFAVFFDADGKVLRTQGDPLPPEDQFVAQINALHGGLSKAKTLTAAQLQAQIDAAQKSPRKPVATASAPQGPLTLVAPAAEISRLEALTTPAASASQP